LRPAEYLTFDNEDSDSKPTNLDAVFNYASATSIPPAPSWVSDTLRDGTAKFDANRSEWMIPLSSVLTNLNAKESATETSTSKSTNAMKMAIATATPGAHFATSTSSTTEQPDYVTRAGRTVKRKFLEDDEYTPSSEYPTKRRRTGSHGADKHTSTAASTDSKPRRSSRPRKKNVDVLTDIAAAKYPDAFNTYL
jgi:hypothetical protein